MKFSFDKILAAFGNMRAMERTHVDDYTENIINSIKEEPFALSESNVMYAGIKELVDYYYLKTIIVGTFKIKTFKGATLNLNFENKQLQLNSDMFELESDFSNVSNRYITSIDFEINEEDIKKIYSSKIESLQLLAKKQDIIFKPIEKPLEKR